MARALGESASARVSEEVICLLICHKIYPPDLQCYYRSTFNQIGVSDPISLGKLE